MRFDFGSLARRLVTAAIVWTGAATVGAAAEGPVDVTIDFAKVMRLDTPARTVIVGNPGIADASIDNEKTLVLTEKTAGTTNLIVLDVNGHEILNSTIRVSSDVHQLTTVFYGANRETFSCAPVCEQVISVGDEKDKFDNATAQIQTRQELSK
jgi:Flp pilus assembly secretin CpaC